MKITGVVDYRLTEDLLRNVVPRQIPYALASTMTALAGDVQAAVQADLPVAFDNPTDYTLRGVWRKPATKSDLTAEVYIPQSADEEGRAAREYMRPGADGASSRRQKRTEFLLTRIGALPPGWVTVPGRGAPLNGFGNIEGLVYKQIINVLQIRYNKPKPVSKRSQKAASKLGVQALFFVVKPGANELGRNGGYLPSGVWKHLPGGGITQVLKFVRSAKYRKRLDLDKIGERVVEAKAGQRWSEASAAIAARFAQPTMRLVTYPQ
jgi:hypothetical protein